MIDPERFARIQLKVATWCFIVAATLIVVWILWL